MNNKVLTIDSREISKMGGMEHKLLLRKLEGGKDRKGIIEILTKNHLAPSDYFIKSTYVDSTGKENKCYLFTKMGCEFISNKFTGEKGILFTARYVKKFNEIEADLKDIDNVMKEKGNMDLEDYNKIRFSEKRTINTFADSNVDDVKQLVQEFTDHAIGLDTKTRVVRCNSAIKGLQRLHNIIAKESALNIADCYKILQYIDRIKAVAHEAENRHRGQKIAHRNRKINELQKQVI